MHTDVPFSPQALMSRVTVSNSDTNNSIVEVTWTAPGNDSWVDFYHYQLFDSLIKVNASAILETNTTNTTVIIDGSGLSTILLFVLSACNCKGRSAPVELVIINGKDMHILIFNLSCLNKHTHITIINNTL